MPNRRDFNKRGLSLAAGSWAAKLTGQHDSLFDQALGDIENKDGSITVTEVEPITIKGARNYRGWNLVRLTTDRGIRGIGEGFAFAWDNPVPPRKIHKYLQQLGSLVQGRSPFQIRQFLSQASARPPKQNPRYWFAAVSAIEIALWDIVGQSLHLPIHRLLGGKLRDRIPLYANHGVFFLNDVEYAFNGDLIGGLKDAGYQMYKFDPFEKSRGNPEIERLKEEVRAVEQVRDIVGPGMQLGIDAHSKFDLQGSIKAAKLLEPFDLTFFEEPTHFRNIHWYKPIAESTTIPLATGEHFCTDRQCSESLQTGAVGVLQPELGCLGGILNTVSIAKIAASFGVQVFPHNWCGPVVTRALVHASAMIPNLGFQEYAAVAPASGWEHDLIEPPNQVERGRLIVPNGPGLGLTLNEAIVEKRRIA